MTKKVVYLLIIFVLIVVVRNLIVSIQNLSNNSKIVDNLNKELEAQKKENNFLQQKLSYVKNNEYIEKEAREKLGLVKAGEYVVIAPEPGQKEPTKPETLIPNWQKWLKLFF